MAGEEKAYASVNELDLLEVRGPIVFKGYVNNRSAKMASFTPDGWFRTGDHSMIDRAGMLHLVGRTNDTMNINSVKHLPNELEAAIEDSGRYCSSHNLHTGSRPSVLQLNETFLQRTTLENSSRAKIKIAFERGDYKKCLKFMQENANLSHNYTLPPNTAVSRFIYVSESLSGERYPVSGYVLWPYIPHLDANGGKQVVAWAHGTPGTPVSTAPSRFKNLWNHFIAQTPYQLLLQGYVVEAMDYAGLGVASDVVYSVQAARKGFPQLSESFIVLGYGQGGGNAWGAAQKHAISNIPGYLGAMSISPATNILDNPEPFGSLIAATMAPGIASLYPEFNYNKFLTSEGLELLKKIGKLDCASSTTTPILLTLVDNLLKPDWASNEWLLKYKNLTANSGRKISVPLLVIQGDNDPMVNYDNTIKKT
ncbi:hypothetical protein BTUL_0105g00420 [Botrytis tulipae]|uniref:Uncharacterized protein n=1 Tax=Botrytis tulipae TaxID=87230 RepID=A0A4Z1EL86_9HELO|nr:hypothetical protein BTUL_0105g00420 [Botrytis tulipae]